MDAIRDYLEIKWDEEGIIPDLHTIEEDLQDVISCDEASYIPNVVERFMKFIRPSEGIVLYKSKRAATIG